MKLFSVFALLLVWPLLAAEPPFFRPFYNFYEVGKEGGRFIEYEKSKNSKESLRFKERFDGIKFNGIEIKCIKYSTENLPLISPLKCEDWGGIAIEGQDANDFIKFVTSVFPEKTKRLLEPIVRFGLLYEFKKDAKSEFVFIPFEMCSAELYAAEVDLNKDGNIESISLSDGCMSASVPPKIFMDHWRRVVELEK